MIKKKNLSRNELNEQYGITYSILYIDCNKENLSDSGTVSVRNTN